MCQKNVEKKDIFWSFQVKSIVILMQCFHRAQTHRITIHLRKIRCDNKIWCVCLMKKILGQKTSVKSVCLGLSDNTTFKHVSFRCIFGLSSGSQNLRPVEKKKMWQQHLRQFQNGYKISAQNRKKRFVGFSEISGLKPLVTLRYCSNSALTYRIGFYGN